MRHQTTRIFAAFAGLLLSTAITHAQAFDMSWYTIDGGGATFSTGGAFELGGTIGQPDAGVLSGGVFELSAGFWMGGAVDPCTLPGDLDGDRDVDLTDLATLLSNFGVQGGATPAMGDTDGDTDVDLGDLSVLLSQLARRARR